MAFWFENRERICRRKEKKGHNFPEYNSVSLERKEIISIFHSLVMLKKIIGRKRR